jgi:acyl carrier protein
MSALDTRLRAIVRDLTQAAIPPEGDVRFSTLPGWDSVTHLHLLLDVERTFDLEIPDAVGMSLQSIGALHDYIAAQRPGLTGGGG